MMALNRSFCLAFALLLAFQNCNVVAVEDLEAKASMCQTRGGCTPIMIDETEPSVAEIFKNAKPTSEGKLSEAISADGTKTSSFQVDMITPESKAAFGTTITCRSSCTGNHCTSKGCDASRFGCTPCYCSGISCARCTCVKKSTWAELVAQ